MIGILILLQLQEVRDLELEVEAYLIVRKVLIVVVVAVEEEEVLVALVEEAGVALVEEEEVAVVEIQAIPHEPQRLQEIQQALR